jgi:quinoprotein glucose dehydrogenase
MCPIRARYSPDLTFFDLVEAGKIELIPRTLVRKLVLEGNSNRIERAVAVARDDPDDAVEFRARTFVLAGGFIWAPHLLLLSANERFPDGLANRSGLVGKYMCGHRYVTAQVSLPLQLFPGLNRRNSLLSKRFQRPGPLDRYVRHDLRIWESTVGEEPRFRDDAGGALLGDEVLADWRERTKTGAARLRSYYDVIPHRESRLTLDGTQKNRWGDPLPRFDFRDSDESASLRDHTEESIRGVFEELVRAGNGSFTSVRASDTQDHAGGGCRMGTDPASSVVDRYGRSHDHENLFVVGAPTKLSAGCCNGALTIQALSLWSASKIGEEFPARS